MLQPERSLSDAHRQLTRARLVTAAARLFQEHGYSGTTLRDIAEVAGMSRATIYLHFRSKRELAEAVEAAGGD